MKSISDDGKLIGTEDEVRAYEESQKLNGVIDAQIGEYLDQSTMDVKMEDGSVKQVNLSSRVFTRKENDIKDWIEWDRKQRPWRYKQEEIGEAAVRVVTGAAQ